MNPPVNLRIGKTGIQRPIRVQTDQTPTDGSVDVVEKSARQDLAILLNRDGLDIREKSDDGRKARVSRAGELPLNAMNQAKQDDTHEQGRIPAAPPKPVHNLRSGARY